MPFSKGELLLHMTTCSSASCCDLKAASEAKQRLAHGVSLLSLQNYESKQPSFIYKSPSLGHSVIAKEMD
jgi:hypothetical protein